jgi:hypothetical protein
MFKFKITPVPNQSRLSALAGGLICAGLSGIGFWIVFTHKHLGGGLPFIPETWNQALGRVFVGVCACVTAFFALCAFYEAFKPRKKQ